MKYFIDTEFLEGTQKKFFGMTKPMIDLISIGIINEKGETYYAISKDFNLKEAWNRWDKKPCCNMPELCGAKMQGDCEGFKKEYWIRDNVLRPIYNELLEKERYARMYHWNLAEPFCYRTLKTLIRWSGKTNKQIAKEVKNFVYSFNPDGYTETAIETNINRVRPIEFYGYYADYDWVVFCWLFGRMVDLPKEFPYYMLDIQQIIHDNNIDKDLLLKEVPQINCHSAISDATWNKDAFNWICWKLNENGSANEK